VAKIAYPVSPIDPFLGRNLRFGRGETNDAVVIALSELRCVAYGAQRATGGCERIMQIFAILVLGLMCGSELNVGAFAHPASNHQSLQVHIPVRAALAAKLGRVMPFWMAGSTLLNLLLLLPFVGLSGLSWRLAAISFAIQIGAVAFSLIGPVPINNRIMKWTSENLPADWKEQESRWNSYHLGRTNALISAFGLLICSLAVR